MSAPVPEPDDGSSKDGPSNYAPKQVRQAEPDLNPAQAPPKGKASAAQGAASESAEPPWKRSKQSTAFAGDVAAAELRAKLALAPDRLPEPPPPSSTGGKYGWASRLAGIAVVTAVGFIGYRLGSAPPGSPPPALPSSRSNQQASAPKRPVTAPQSAEPALGSASPAAANAIVPLSNEQRSRENASLPALSRQLTVGAVRPQQVDKAARLTVSVKNAGSKAAVVISRLPAGSALSEGAQVGPDRWQLPAEELTVAAVTPPRGFVGTMDLILELRLADNTVADRKSLQLEWLDRSGLAAAEPQPRQHSAAEIALMMKIGADLITNGDIAGARLMYRRLAEEGEAPAAFALAETYDPLVLRKLNIAGGMTPDVALAQSWYEKAKALGSPVAAERLERLARVP
jgi:TPR repeat protein